MSKLYKALTTQEKTDKVVKNQLPSFAGRFFRDNKGIMAEETLYNYAFDIASFFSYLEETKGLPVKDITLKIFESITVSDIENYMSASQEYIQNGIKRQRSSCAIRRRHAALQSFYMYYFRSDLIESIPTLKVATPRLIKKAADIPNTNDNKALIDFIINGSLPGERAAAHQKHYRERDAAIVSLMICAGIKASEVRNLNIYDLQLDKGYIIVKGRALSCVQISDFVVKIVSAYLSIRIGIITEYGHEDALFLSSFGRRMTTRSLQLMVKKYTTALFGEDSRIAPKDLSFSFREVTYNAVQSVSATALISGSTEDTIIRTHLADLKERQTNTVINYSSI